MKMSVSLSEISQYASFLLGRLDAPALRKNGRHLGQTSYGLVTARASKVLDNRRPMPSDAMRTPTREP